VTRLALALVLTVGAARGYAQERPIEFEPKVGGVESLP